ncbi:phage tail sheath subtilisin-like domain-containing protein [Brevibacillus thermoruber]|uniref:phage tail sheath subtilisin-like domain-containing protein n=1 Tax=Brevibacillus thermoruber TaxID=33942 RepID=UPI00048EC737|nr:phage tail sheath subtilisin-like domain-containing protein [Brevibacillus thermoruber]
MATGGKWDATSLPRRPGLYINFVEAAAAQIKGGARGVVAIPLKSYTGGTASAETFYTVTTEKEATDLFGSANIQSIKFALQGGAKEVLVYTMPESPTTQDFADMRAAFDARPFNVFVYDDNADSAEQDAALAWMKTNKDEGKHFMIVFGGSSADDNDPAVGDARSIRLADDYAVNLITGVKIGGTSYSSAQYAPFIAGLIAGTPINKSITYAQVPVDDVTKRLTNSQIKTSLEKGSLVLVHDGEKVKVEQGICTSSTASKTVKIRTIRARQAVSMDVTKTAADAYIGKIDNNPDGQAALIAAVKAYLERLQASNVLMDPVVTLDPQFQSVGDSVYLLISYVEVDSMERIFLTINV